MSNYIQKLLLSFAPFIFLSNAISDEPQKHSYEFITPKYLSSVDSLVFLERTTCYGWCPAYRLCFQSDGTILFEGSEYTERLGLQKGASTTEEFLTLVDRLTSLGIFSMDNRYDGTNPDCKQSYLDAPTVTVLIKLGDQSKRILHYHGCRGFPRESDLLKIEAAIDNSTKSSRWVGER
jgi:hypothetical protein